jgi:hypothetical protein
MNSIIIGMQPPARGWGPKKNGGQAAQALGRPSGGSSNKIYVGCLGATTSASLELTSGSRHDAPVFETVLA